MFLLCLSGLVLLLNASSSQVNADHALSEVWSEAEGLQMKYSTNHDDLLSTKGSELSLSTTQQNREAEPATAQETQEGGQSAQGAAASEETAGSTSGSGDESATAAAAAASGEDSGNQNQESASPSASSEEGQSSNQADEQGADATRQSDMKVPLNKQYSSASTNTKKQLFNEPPMRFRTSLAAEQSQERPTGRQRDASGNGEDEQADQGIPKAESYNSALEQAEDGSETASVDPGDDSSSNAENQQSALMSKFSHPGRHFKEAVRFNSEDSDAREPASSNKGKQPAVNNSDNESVGAGEDSENASNEPASNSASDNDENQSVANQQQPSDKVRQVNNADDENDGSELFSSTSEQANSADPKSFRASKTMIDFDRVVDNKRIVAGNYERPSTDREMTANVEGGEPGEGPESNGFSMAQNSANSDEFGSFLRQNRAAGEQFNSARTEVTAHKERVPNYAKRPQQVPAATSKPAKPLAYFRGVQQQQQQQQQAQVSAGRLNQVRLNESPDNVRDNFISPGHYPGSMPHLNSAASETLPAQSESQTSRSGEQLISSASQKTTTLSQLIPTIQQETTTTTSNPSQDNNNNNKPALFDTSDTAFELQFGSSSSATNSIGTKQDTLARVTPEPEIQPEAQQIMAPILISTTTMAPMPAATTIASSPAPATTTSQSPSTATTSSSTTTAAPSLKRFKFRKYR